MGLIVALTVNAATAQSLLSEFTRLEEVWNLAHRTGDAHSLDQMWAADLEVDVPRMPPMNKAEALAFASSGRMRFDRYETSDIKVRQYGETVVVTGRLLRTRVVDGTPRDDDWRFTKVYTRSNDGWRVASFHASEAPPR